MKYWQLKIDRPFTGSETFDLRTQRSVTVGDSAKNDICVDSTDIPGSLRVVKRTLRNKLQIELTVEVSDSLRGHYTKTKDWNRPLYSGETFEATGLCEWEIGETHFTLVPCEKIPMRPLPPVDRSEEQKHWKQSFAAAGAFHAALFLAGFVFMWASKFFSPTVITPADIQKVSVVNVNKVFSKPKPVEVAVAEVKEAPVPAVQVEEKVKPAARSEKPGLHSPAKGQAPKKSVTSLGLFAIQSTVNPVTNNLDVAGLAKGSLAQAENPVKVSRTSLGISNGDGVLSASRGEEVARLDGAGVESYRGGLGDKIKQGSFQGASIKLIRREIEIRGGLDPAVIRQIIEERLPEVRYCYETALLKETNLQGKIAASWTIQADGSVAGLSSESDDIKSNILHPCIKEQIKNWKFPSPKGGGVVHVKYPFLFSPLGS